ncbi:Protein CBR-CACN-1 [Caenorhabditis briggsae]|uniref:Splicing factor Cactin n=1 Tax=Caenorhabditis briggsae TaxID=6238 RepID=A8XZ51_CAEBR|nr:Protein CBR-CACN-1 [Caenorhabditis briggsae]CAP37918.2 Protein CBR-CACN-1 [Caenorhabditis briggsae]
MGREHKKHKKDRKRHRSRSRSSTTDSDDERRFEAKGKEQKRHKKDKKRRRSPSRSSSADSSDEERRFDKNLEEQRQLKKAQLRRQKEEMKAKETPEEKKARRMAKKMQKDEKRRAAEAEDTLIPPELNYTNLNNPFNDTKLTTTFVWGKKLEKEGRSGLTQDQITKEASQRIRKNLTEAAEFKRIRDSRAAVKEDMEMMKRDADLRASQKTDSKEREFQLDQVKERTRIRIDQGRAKAIDLLSRYIRYAGENFSPTASPDFELVNPIEYIRTTCKSIDDFEDLLEDISTYRELDGRERHEVWWNDVTQVVEDEMKKKNSQRRGEVHSILDKDVIESFKDQSISQLEALEIKIAGRLRDQSNKEFWLDMEHQCKSFLSRKRLRENHNKVMRNQLLRIREDNRRDIQSATENMPIMMETPQVKRIKSEEDEEEDDDDDEKLSKKVRRKIDVKSLDDPELDEQERERKWRALTEDQLEDVTLELYRLGSFSPPYNSFDDTMPGIEVVDAQSDMESLMAKRSRNRGEVPTSSAEASSAPDSRMLAIARQGMEGDESMFSVEEQLETQKHLWSDKYRPRKPTYLNRVQTGFDWNKYNQTHYDQDNPPPKIVQGYKFNIFYPDLLDVTQTPTFTITPCDDKDFAIIRFKSGPPYEDIAFKVVNREWETLHKNGYKCQFQNGVFQLWFMFKKYRYRR